MLLQPLIEATSEESHDEFEIAIRKSNEVIASIFREVFKNPLEVMSDDEDEDSDSFLATDIRWSSLLPRDVKSEIDAVKQMLELKIISRAEAARRVGDITDTERAVLEMAADETHELAMNVEKARALQGQPPNFVAATLSSLFHE